MIALLKVPLSMLIRLKGNYKCISSNLLSPLRAENKDIATALQTLLTGVRLHLHSYPFVYKGKALKLSTLVTF